MKRTGNLIDKIISSENMFLAFKEARKGKTNNNGSGEKYREEYW